MKKTKPFVLDIPNPCHQKWDEMTPIEQGRFCSNCQKKVVDISQMSDAALHQLLKTSTELPCISAYTHQLNRLIEPAPIAKPKKLLYPVAIAASMATTIPNFVQAQNSNQVKTTHRVDATNNPIQIENSLIIKVNDIYGQVISNASVVLITNDTTNKFLPFDSCEKVYLCPKQLDATKTNDILVSCHGYETKKIRLTQTILQEQHLVIVLQEFVALYLQQPEILRMGGVPIRYEPQIVKINHHIKFIKPVKKKQNKKTKK